MEDDRDLAATGGVAEDVTKIEIEDDPELSSRFNLLVCRAIDRTFQTEPGADPLFYLVIEIEERVGRVYEDSEGLVYALEAARPGIRK